MTRRPKTLLAAAVLAVLGLGVGGLAWYWHETAVDRQVRALLDEVRQDWEEPGWVRRWFIKLKLVEDRRTSRGHQEVIGDLVKVGPAGVPELIRALQAEDHAVRGAAAEALGLIGDQRGRPSLRGVMENASPPPGASSAPVGMQPSWSLGWKCSLALCRLGDPGGVRTLVEWIAFAVDHRGESRRMGISVTSGLSFYVFTIREKAPGIDESWDAIVNMNRGALAPLVECARDTGNATLRHTAIRLLGAIGHPDSVEPLLAMMKTADVETTSRLIHALGLIGDARAIEPVAAAWTSKAAWEVKCAAAEALPRLGPSAIPAAIDCIRRDPEEGVRQVGLTALARTNDPRVIDELLWLIDSDRAHDPVYAARALIHTSGPKVIAGLRKALSHKDFGVRDAAARAMAKLAGPDAVQPLIEMLGDRDTMVRETVAVELGNLRAAEAVPGLSRLTGDESWGIRSTAVRALGKIGAEDGLPAVQERLTDPSEHVREAAEEAIKQIRRKIATKPAAATEPAR